MKTITVLQGMFISLFLVFAACERTKEPAQTAPAPEPQESSSNTSEAAPSSEQNRPPIQSLSSSADKLVNDFNSISGKKKLVMILSPT